MCGIAGAIFNDRDALGRARTAVDLMVRRLRNRGPDARGMWEDPKDCVVLGHTRLSVLDLEARSNQPMVSRKSGNVLVYNGEIYNFRELRAELEKDGVDFHTESDSEVLLALYERHGEGMLSRLRGMFAFAIWDRSTETIFLARDPYGIKPLYIASTADGVLFASQVKALLETGLASREPDPVGHARFFLLGSVPEPRTWFRDIRMLRAGHFARIARSGLIAEKLWLDIGDEWRAASGSAVPSREVEERVRAALLNSVRAHLVSDVPVGVFLSGGIDSGTVASLMAEAGCRDLQGVTLRFDEFEGTKANEVPAASRIAEAYGIKHYVRTVTRPEFEADLPKILDAMDQPTVDGVNTWFASKAVAELGLKVVVSGVGGDELFQGYSSFSIFPRLMALRSGLSHIPGGLRIVEWMCAWRARQTGQAKWRALAKDAASIEGAWFLSRSLYGPSDLRDLVGGDVVAQGFDPVSLVRELTGPVPADARTALSHIESVTYLRNQVLRDSDWASMAHSIELRTPLVDAWLLHELSPVLEAFGKFPRKRLLAEAPRNRLSEDVLRRPKTGFAIPVHRWLAKGAGMASSSRQVALDFSGRVYDTASA